MPARKLLSYLDENGVKYVCVRHSPSFTAQEIAASAHIPGKELAKSVVVRIDEELALAVVPASYRVDFELLKATTHAQHVSLAEEETFRDRFPGCELGAMPPFGNLYGMETFVADSLADDEEIAFNAGSHTELVRMAYADFERLARPKVLHFASRVC